MGFNRERFREYNKMVSSKKSLVLVYYICLTGIFVSLSLLFFIKTFVSRDIPSINYKESSSIDYDVRLKDNNYYETDILPSNMDYIASLIDTINLKFNYTFTTNREIDYDASYYIEAITRVYGKDNKSVLYEKSEVIKKSDNISKRGIMANSFYEEVAIDYDHFNSFAKSFKASYFLNYDSDVSIVLHVSTKGVNASFDKGIDSDGIALVVIPLTEQTINVSIDSKNINNTGSVSSSSIWDGINYIYFGLLVVCLILDIYFLYCLVLVIIKSYKRVSEYDRVLKRILRDYDSIIANSVNDIDVDGYKVIDLCSFEELRDVHDNIGNPIIFYESIRGKISYFCIIDGEILYRFTLDSFDMKKRGR